MRQTFHGSVLALIVLLLSAVPLLGHHAFQAEFDENKLLKLTGILTKIEWINPHVYFYLDVTDQSGKLTNWALESVTPAGLRKAGLTKSGFFEVGQTYTVTVCGAKDDSKNLAWVKDFKFPDGRVVTIWFGNPNGL